ncbi:hypothetical protein QCA50_008733 [Cerrena zonata]|uniref:Uncharacterized protein n=1 Tax=Cerrena zonata TaxID=2478898 RepID=A0AAW0G6E1_9APHY
MKSIVAAFAVLALYISIAVTTPVPEVDEKRAVAINSTFVGSEYRFSSYSRGDAEKRDANLVNSTFVNSSYSGSSYSREAAEKRAAPAVDGQFVNSSYSGSSYTRSEEKRDEGNFIRDVKLDVSEES